MHNSPSTLTAVLISIAVLAIISVVAFLLRDRKRNQSFVTARSAPSPNDLADPHRVSPGMTEAKFWELVEHSWGAGATPLRHQLLDPELARDAAHELMNMSEFMLMSLEESLYLLSKEDLQLFDRILKSKIIELNCMEAKEMLALGQHPYGHVCSFVVAAGRDVYTAVHIDPTVWSATESLDAFSLVPERVYQARFGALLN